MSHVNEIVDDLKIFSKKQLSNILILIVLCISIHINALSQYKYDDKATERFIFAIREYRAIQGVTDSVAKKIKTETADSTWTINFQDSVQVTDEFELAILYGVEAKKMNDVVSEAYANEMFNRLIENNPLFKEYCMSLVMPKSIIYCLTRYTSEDSYYVFTILKKQ